MNLLELVIRTRQECSGSGAVPTTVVGQSGMNARFVNWVIEAWKSIQESQRDWKFLRKEFSFNVAPAASDYPPYLSAGTSANLQDFDRWHLDTFRLYAASLGEIDEQFLVNWDYAAFRNTYRFGARTATRPMVFAVRPRDEAIMFDATPDQNYTCAGDYQRKPVTLAADQDTPEIDSRYHMGIVYKAMISYGIDQAASEVIARGQVGYNDLVSGMNLKYLPDIVI